jgi:D-serine dehydratase
MGLEGIPDAVRHGVPTVWRNPACTTRQTAGEGLPVSLADVHDAQRRWERFAVLLETLFPELVPSHGHIDSELVELDEEIRESLDAPTDSRVFAKTDHALPIAGSIKARGGVYEVLAHAEEVAQENGLLDKGTPYSCLAEPRARDLFAQRKVVVGSTGNLGFSVGVMARRLGFAAEVHMSSDAKAWKKERLRRIGVNVVEHASDYSRAVAAARDSARSSPASYFVDDEDSIRLFLGYAVGAFDLQRQLNAAGVAVHPKQRLVVYLPCGVGGAPGGLCFGLKAIFGESVTCVFVEPVAAPCMLVQLASGVERSVSVYDIGLDNRTEADGLAVASASMFVARTVPTLLDAIVTVDDDALFGWAFRMWKSNGFRLEPSGAAGFAAMPPFKLASTQASHAGKSTHVVWTTGGSLLPDEEFSRVLERGRLQSLG